MSKLKSYFLLALSSLIIVTISCKRKDKVGETTNNKSGVLTANSFYMEDFVIQDAADSRVLDFQDVHRIAQATPEEVAKGAVDTIYCSMLETVDITKLKLKPRFYDVGRVEKIVPDTSELLNISNDGVTYPTLKVSFNTGLTRTFAIVASKTTASQDQINLLNNQNIYYISQYAVSNGVSDIPYTPLPESIAHVPLFKQNLIVDTIVFSVTTDDIGNANQNVVFTPKKYGKDNTDTVVAQFDPASSLQFDKTTENNVYKSMRITFASGFTREYWVKANIVNLNIARNRDEYFMKTYKVENGLAIPADITSAVKQDSFTRYTPTDFISQNDTLVLYIPGLQYSKYPIIVKPATWGLAGVTASYTLNPTNGVSFTHADTGNVYKPLEVTFPNGFKRIYYIKIHQEVKPINPIVDFNTFKVLNVVNSLYPTQYTKLDSTGLSIDGYSYINSADSGVMIIRPLTGWTDSRKVTIEIIGLEPEVRGTLSLYPSATGDIGASTSLDASVNGQMIVDFTNNPTDSVKLTLTNTSIGGETRNYKIKLLSGILYKNIKEVIDGTGNNRDNTNFGAGNSGTYNNEMSISVDKNYVYVLKGGTDNTALENWGTLAIGFAGLRKGDSKVFAYDISTGTGVTTAPIAVATMTINVDSLGIISIFSIKNELYGIGMSAKVADATSAKNYVYKWASLTSLPTQVTGKPLSGSMFYSINSAFNNNEDTTVFLSSIGGNLAAGAGAAYYKIGPKTVTMSSSSFKAATGNSGGAQGTTFLRHIVSAMDTAFFIMTSKGMSYYRSKIWASASPVTVTDSFHTNPYNGQTMSLQGGNIYTIRDRDYLFTTEMFPSTTSSNNHGGSIFDLGKGLGDLTKNVPSATSGNGHLATLRKKHFLMPAGVSPTYQKGGCRTYVLPDGTIRVAYLVNGIGFKVFDIN